MKQLIKFIFLAMSIVASGENTEVMHTEGYDETSSNLNMRDVSYDDNGLTVAYHIPDLLIHKDSRGIYTRGQILCRESQLRPVLLGRNRPLQR